MTARLGLDAAFLEPAGRSERGPARVVVLPVPYEATVSWRGGTGEGPGAILAASQQLELYNERTGEEAWRSGIWTAPPLQPPRGGLQAAAAIGNRVGEFLDEGKWTVMLGGEHGITPGAVAAVAQRYPDLHVLQLDAHSDLRDSYEGNPFSHACAMARCMEHAPVRGVGIRSSSAEEAARIRDGIPGYRGIHAKRVGEPGWIDEVLEGLDGRPIYLTIDVDYFDPSLIPATGTPEPGGGSWWPTLELLERLFERCRVVGADVVELAPHAELHHADFTVARLVYELIGFAVRKPVDLTSAAQTPKF